MASLRKLNRFTFRRFLYVPLFSLLLFTLNGCATPASADNIRLADIFADHMVLQAEHPLPVWGWTDPCRTVTVSFADQQHTALAGPDGAWRVTLDPLPADKSPASLTVTADHQSLTLNDILVGQVWLCSGQSNMEMSLRQSTHGPETIAHADLPLLRLATVSHQVEPFPVDHVPVTWSVSSPDTARDFSAVAFYFGENLLKNLDTPIGLIQAAWGGTSIEPWMPRQAFTPDRPGLVHDYKWLHARDRDYRHALRAAVRDLQQWLDANENAQARKSWTTRPPDLPRHLISTNFNYPTVLYNGMIHPLIPFTIRGVIWYQGESNVRLWHRYYDFMTAWIHAWRSRWQRPDLPVYFVQIAPRHGYEPGRFPRLHQAQFDIHRDIPHTGMAVIHDTAETLTIHPPLKKPVGRRLARWALAQTYHLNVPCSGPLYRDHRVEQNRVRVFFDHAQGLTTSDDQPPTDFTIAGPDYNFVPARAVVDNDTVLVSSPDIDNPVAVRFGWSMTARPNLINAARLYASPFRTDYGPDDHQYITPTVEDY